MINTIKSRSGCIPVHFAIYIQSPFIYYRRTEYEDDAMLVPDNESIRDRERRLDDKRMQGMDWVPNDKSMLEQEMRSVQPLRDILRNIPGRVRHGMRTLETTMRQYDRTAELTWEPDT